MESVKDFVRQIKWYEWLYMSIFICIIICLSCVFKSNLIVLFNSIFGILTVFFLAKGKVIGNVLGIVQCILYVIVSYFNKFYGEIILCCFITIPLYVVTIITWLKNLSNKDKVVQVNKSLSSTEWVVSLLIVALISFGLYFLLDYFNTAYLIVSTFSVFSCIMAGYLAVRRSEYNFIFYILNNIVCICLWLFVIIQNNDLSYVSIVVQYTMFLILNIVGTCNWLKLKKIQKLRSIILKKKNKKYILDIDYMNKSN